MNIFQVLSQGRSRLHEPSMSAMLGYLLDSHKDHGLADTFVRAFLETLNPILFKNALAQSVIHSYVELEVGYELNGSAKFIDIELSLWDDEKEIYKIIIENKIKIGAANPKQLTEYYKAILQDDLTIKNLVMVFLTPESNAPLLSAEFNNLGELPDGHHKHWLFWDSLENVGVVSMVRKVLGMESEGRINPINEYMRHTLKAFIRHASAIVDTRGIKNMRTGEDIGEILEEANIRLNDGTQYQVIRRDSTQIQVFNLETGEKEIARRVLAKFIDENKINIPHRELNTRSIGRQFFKWRSNS